MNEQERLEHHAQEYGLTIEQARKLHTYAAKPLNQWPEGAHRRLREMSAESGLCGESFFEALAAWIKEQPQ